jgi:N4-gp56 family major capsid protein
MVFRRYEKLSQTTVPLTEGITPTGTTLSKTDVVATLLQYGNYCIITDWVDMTSVDPTINEASELMGENMGESIDSIHANALSAGTNYYRVIDDDGGTVNIDDEVGASARSLVAGTLCKTVLDAAIRDLNGADARMFTPMVPGSAKINTYPIGKAYWCLIHPDQEHDLYQANGGFFDSTANNMSRDFVPVHKYANNRGAMETEIGSYRNIRLVMTTNLKIWTGEGEDTSDMKETVDGYADVYSVLVFGRDAYGIVPLAGDSAKVIVKSAKSGGSADPLEQRNTVGWKAATALAILNDAWMVRIECATLA